MIKLESICNILSSHHRGTPLQKIKSLHIPKVVEKPQKIERVLKHAHHIGPLVANITLKLPGDITR